MKFRIIDKKIYYWVQKERAWVTVSLIIPRIVKKIKLIPFRLTRLEQKILIWRGYWPVRPKEPVILMTMRHFDQITKLNDTAARKATKTNLQQAV